MPKGKIELIDGEEIFYDDMHKEGEILIIKTSNTHEVRTIPLKKVKIIKVGEKHRTIIGYCKKLTKEEIENALKTIKEGGRNGL
jgi:hypothetical protein